MTDTPLLRKFLALDRLAALYHAFQESSCSSVTGHITTMEFLVGCLIALVPALPHVSPESGIDFPTIALGIATCLSILFRSRSGIRAPAVRNWRESLKITHTAFALGCIPIVAVVLLHPQALFTLQQHVDPQVAAENSQSAPSSAWALFLFIALVSLWAGVTEEFIYRGMLVSISRRISWFSSQRSKDIFAIAISALIFGATHVTTWGWTMGIALIGIGAGFGTAYVAIGERITPLIIYHIVFDALSLSFAILSNK